MKPSQVQPYLKAQLLANATIAAFGDPLVSSLENEETTVKELIDARLRDPGVGIVIGEVAGSTIAELHPGGHSSVLALVDIFIAEKISAPTHSPRGLALIETVVAAVTLGRRPVQWTSHESVVSEHGYALHVLSFSIPVVVTQ